MLYKSTRGGEDCDGVQALLRGLAPDGGLYVPARIKPLKEDFLAKMPCDYFLLGEKVVSALLPDFRDMGAVLRRAYEGKFDTPELTPLVPVGDDYVLELWHGPTSAFKDMALSLLPLLLSAARKSQDAQGESVILTATSGDTGKAALEGFHDVEGTRIFVFYPQGGVSPIQEKQMLTQRGANVRVCAVKGNFDDCQSGVKEALSALSSSEGLAQRGFSFSSANSINIGRLAPQAVYYFYAYVRLLRLGRIRWGDKVDFVVPTGNFGDILAGYYAKALGLPVGTLVCASNANRVLTDFFATGRYDRRRDFMKTSSPSMDILVSSNLERLIYHCSDGDDVLVKYAMYNLQREGYYDLPERLMERIRESFAAGCCDEAETAAAIADIWRRRQYLCDPHTAVAMKVAGDYKADRWSADPVVVLSTASPFKFPAAVLSALGEECEAEDGSGDEFDALRRLSELTKSPIPKNLAALESLPALHDSVIERRDITSWVREELEA